MTPAARVGRCANGAPGSGRADHTPAHYHSQPFGTDAAGKMDLLSRKRTAATLTLPPFGVAVIRL